MIRNGKLVVIVISLFIVGGCFSPNVQMESFTDPEYRETTHNNVLVFANIASFELKERMEQIIVEELNQNSIHAAKSINYFPPTRELDPDKIGPTAEKEGFDSILFINVIGADVVTTQFTTPKSGTVQAYGSRITYQEYGGQVFQVTRPQLALGYSLININKRELAWIGQSYIGGRGIDNFDSLISVGQREAAKRLMEDRILEAEIPERDVDFGDSDSVGISGFIESEGERVIGKMLEDNILSK